VFELYPITGSIQRIASGFVSASGAGFALADGEIHCAMDITVSDRSEAYNTSPVAVQIPRRPLWPALVIAFAISVTMLWTALLLWLLSRAILLYFDILF
jgi:hypothetical protein